MSLSARMEAVLARMRGACERAGRDPGEVRLLGASKKQPPEKIREAWEAGLRLAGENRLGEALGKMRALEDLDGLAWHFIGPLQSRKCREVAGAFDMVQSVDRLKIVRRLARFAEERERALPVLVEVNTGEESTKAGCPPGEAEDLVRACAEAPTLGVEGLMHIPPHTDDPEGSRPYHRKLRELRDRLRETTGQRLEILSMGMSHDLEVAVEEGSTLVRIGTDLFGPRP